MNPIHKILFFTLIFVIFSSCRNNQNTKTSDYETIPKNSHKVLQESINKSYVVNSEQIHKVVVKEVLPATKYVYLLVDEGKEPYWIATIHENISVGQTYSFKGGLLKTNFESKEHKRIFDKIYLVSKLVELNEGNTTNNQKTKDLTDKVQTKTVKTILQKGSIKIAEIVNNPQKYSGKSVQVSGICTKINPGIMNRNWIHLKDGSKDDYDLVVTSDVFVPMGTAITIKADVSINKDFGAGYTYSLILENGVLIK